MKACFMGLGYIGLPTAIIAAKHGIQVTGVDINPKVVELTNQGKLHIIEPGMEEYLQEVVKSGALKASTTPEVSEAYFMVVPTPFKGNHEPIFLTLFSLILCSKHPLSTCWMLGIIADAENYK